MNIAKEDIAMLYNLKMLAKTNNSDSIAITLELPRMVTIRTTYNDLYQTLESLLDLYQDNKFICLCESGDAEKKNKTAGMSIKEIKNKPVVTTVLCAGEVAVSYSHDDMLHSFRKALDVHENIINLKEKGGLTESIRQKD
ncbi:hypothetical protein GL503_17460 [Salmonella enterica]|uniref:Uncharacterized protein n=1 Tax=Salmonella enterica I TaxID=59201 RepID=A0A403QN46_SALET|nr:hypothetical protein [Salmonella enterica]MML56252.1 hypothetical protein [Salmonella enterica subsp. enterica serovar Kidderminster]